MAMAQMKAWVGRIAALVAGVPMVLASGVAVASPGMDISRIEAVKDQLPPGYSPVPRASVASIIPDRLLKDSANDLINNAVVTPPECVRTAPDSVRRIAGSRSDFVVAFNDGHQLLMATGIETPSSIPPRSVPPACATFTVLVPGKYGATVDLIPAPPVAGSVFTMGARVSTHSTEPGQEQTQDTTTTYQAQLDATHVVSAAGTAGVDDADLQQLFRTAVTAVRG